jgi:tRNA-(ms[2]io[6]A)-hydroxylase
MGVLRLQLPTDPRWVNIVEKILKKSERIMLGANKSSYKCNLITNNSGHQDLVQIYWLWPRKIDHFEQVHNIIIKRG